jgi:Aldehyde dehydrogenase family
VAAGIVPWNFPIQNAAWKLAPALAAGCSMILKPAEQTPRTAVELAKLCADAGVPDGVVNKLPGFGPEAGEPLVTSPGVDKIAFTGSTEVGKRVAALAATVEHIRLDVTQQRARHRWFDVTVPQALSGARRRPPALSDPVDPAGERRSGVVAVDRLRDAGGSVAALELDGEVDDRLHGVAAHLLHRVDPSREPDPRADRHGCREA